MIDVIFSQTNTTFSSEFSDEDNVFETNLKELSGGLNLDHAKLKNRDAVDQHPIKAITGLTSELNSVPKESLSNMDLEKLLNY